MQADPQIQGHGPRTAFQALEKSGRDFPNIGKVAGHFSKHWKTRLAAGLALLAAAMPAGAGAWIGWACGGVETNGGVLLCTTNGADWFRQGVGQLGTAALSGVAAVAGRHVWVVGDPEGGYATIYYSPDAGQHWGRQGEPGSLPDAPLHKIWAVDRHRLWAVGPDGEVVVTDNGGQNWIRVPVGGFTNMLQGVTAVDQYTAWVSGEKNPATGMAGLFYTQDSGQTWTPQTSPAITNANHLLGLYALDPNRVWAIGGHETILVTTNAGAQWDLLFKGTLKDGNEIDVLDDQRIWIANDSIVNWTTNGGATWAGHNTPDYTMDVSTPDGTNIWAISSSYWGGAIYHSADGGATWSGVTNTGWSGLFTVVVQPAPIARTLYVDAAAGHATAPYSSWDAAASNIQDAVAAAADGDLVLVTNGVYDRGGAVAPGGEIVNRVMIAKPIDVRSVNGPDATFIVGAGPDGSNAVRGAYLGLGAQLAGFTITNGHVLASSQGLPVDLAGGGACLEGSALLSNCVVSGNSGSAITLGNSRGTTILGPPQLRDCLVQGNQGRAGAGININGAGDVRHCVITDNTAAGDGGGVFVTAFFEGLVVLIENCFVAGNQSTDEQGAAGGGMSASGSFVIRHCTITENSATGQGGGLYASGDPTRNESELVNTLIYNNTAPLDTNTFAEDVAIRNCCSVPELAGTNNLAADPRLLGVRNPHLAEASPCRGAGTTNAVAAGALDIDGEPRVVDDQTGIGCDEYIATNITGDLSARILADERTVLVDVPLVLAADVRGKAQWQRWQIDTNGGMRCLTNTVHVTQTWPVAGVYTVRLEAVNLDQAVATTLVVLVSASAEHYAAPGGGNIYPYTNWAMAATSLAVAVDTCPAGGVVHVGAGVYREAAAVTLDRALTVLGAGAGASARVDGQNTHACFYLNHPQAVISNLTLVNGYAAAQGGGAYVRDGLVTHCVVVSNYAFSQGGGLDCWGGARVEHCVVSGNEAGKWGGGLMAADQTLVRNCFIQDNLAHNYGGGADIGENVELQNSYITGNRSFGGGGVHLDAGGTARNCTIVKNAATDSGGGVYFRSDTAGATYNCIVYHNEAPVGPNIAFLVHMTGTVAYTCAAPLIGGPGNIAAEPVLLGLDNPHIVAASPGINAGSTNLVLGLEQDIDGEARVYGGTVDMGCDEFIGTNILGPLSAAIRGETQVVAGEAADLFADIRGKAWGYVWTVAGPGATAVVANTFMIDPDWPVAGRYEVVLTASNLATSAAATVSVHVVDAGFTNYVALAGAHVAPYTNWAMAATNLQAAIDECWVGGVVLVQTGRYDLDQTVELAKPITVRGAGARDEAALDGGHVVRVINIADPRAVLEGLTVTRGRDNDAAGIYMIEGTVTNCVIANNISTRLGGGMRCAGHSLLTDSLVSGNISPNWPGGVFCSGYALVRQCIIESNTARNSGGGVYLDQGGTVSGCVLRANAAAKGGGVYLHYAGTVTHSLITSNSGANGAGAYLYWGGVVTNCDITWNWGGQDGGGAWFTSGGLVTDSRIQHNFADQNAGSGGGALLSNGGVLRRCDVSTNSASRGGGVFSQYNRQEGGMIDACHIHHNTAPAGWDAGVGGGVALYQNDAIRDCLIDHNTVDGQVGGLLMQSASLAQNCTIVHNTASNSVGGLAIGAGSEVDNCIIYDNFAPRQANWDVAGDLTVDHACTVPDYVGFTATVTNQPQFAGTATNNYRLLAASPCVNAGVSDYWMADAQDLDGRPRLIGPAVDIGAYEYPLAPDSLVAASNAVGCVQLNWELVTGALGYAIYRSSSPVAPTGALAVVGTDTHSWCDSAAQPGQHYYYWLAARYAQGDSALSASAMGWLRGRALPWLMLLQ